MEEIDLCLNCPLPDCDEGDPGCLLLSPQRRASLRWYLKLKKDPVRLAEYQRKKREIQERWLKTPEGKAKWDAQIRKYRKTHPEVIKEIERRHHERNKVKRLAAHREYMRKRRKREKMAMDMFWMWHWWQCLASTNTETEAEDMERNSQARMFYTRKFGESRITKKLAIFE